jgi:hypothetical protein
VRSHAEINEWTTLVDCGFGTFGNLVADQVDFEGIGSEHLESLFFGKDKSLERMLLFANF